MTIFEEVKKAKTQKEKEKKEQKIAAWIFVGYAFLLILVVYFLWYQ